MVDFFSGCLYNGIQGIYWLNRFDEQCYHPYRDFLMRYRIIYSVMVEKWLL